VIRYGSLAFVLATMLLVACSGRSATQAVLPSLGEDLAPAVAAAPSLPPVPAFVTTAHVVMSGRSPVAIPLRAGFSGNLQPGPGSDVPGGTAAYVVSAGRKALAPLPLPGFASGLFSSSFTLSRPIVLAGNSVFRFNLPRAYIVPKAGYFVALYDPTNPKAGWQRAFGGAASISGTNLTILTQAPAFLAPSVPYVFALYAANARPLAPSGTTSMLRGTRREVYTYAYPTPPNVPSPSPEPGITVNSVVREFVTVGATAAPAAIPSGASGDVHVTEVDTTERGATTSGSDAYVSRGSLKLRVYGTLDYAFAAFASTADVTQTVYATPQVVLQFPRSGTVTWRNAPAATVTQSYADGHGYRRTIAANGTYTETGEIPTPGGTPRATSIVENADGSGAYDGPFYAADPHYCGWQFAAPSTSTIQVSVSNVIPNPSRGTSSCSAPSPQATPPDWFATPPPFAGSSPPSPSFYAESDVAVAGARAPKACGPAAGARATLVTRTIWQMDTIVGYVESSTLQNYVAAGDATVCELLADTLSAYYDWSGDTFERPQFTQSGAALSTLTTTQALWGAGARGAAEPISEPAVAAAQAHFLGAMARHRDALLRRKRP
jgi:hypothetical protein